MGSRISGVILTGGENKRFGGKIKSKVLIGGETIISRIISIVGGLFDEIIIVTNSPAEFSEYFQYRIVKDQFLKAGPIGGIHAAMKYCSNEVIFVFAGDMPFLNKEFIEAQINLFNKNEYDILIPRIGRNIEPLHSIYKKALLNDLERFITRNKNRSLRDFISEMKTGYFEIGESEESKRAFTNINSPADIAQIL
jgi:molybdopterin-guanine dinucleotide biosynthesis protein A